MARLSERCQMAVAWDAPTLKVLDLEAQLEKCLKALWMGPELMRPFK